MAWEQRGTAGPYFYRSVRHGGRVTKVYYGKGVAAGEAAKKVERRRVAREQGRRAILAEMAHADPIRLLTAEADAEMKLLTEATMLAAGFHRSNYGPWRRRRGI